VFRIGSGFNWVRGSGSRKEKITNNKDNQKGRNFVFWSAGVLFGRLEASPVVLKSFKEAWKIKILNFFNFSSSK
jgi:hypothetical protein